MMTLREEMIERFEQVDERFLQIDHRFEQIDRRFEQVDQRFEQIDRRFEQVDQRFDQVDERFEQVDQRFGRVEKRLEDGFAAVTEQLIEQRAYTEFGYERLDKGFHTLGGGIARLERKLDRILALSVESRGRNHQ